MAPPLAGARKLSSTSTMKGTLSKTSLSFVYRPANAHRQGNSLEMRGNTKRDLIEKTDENGNTIYVVDREVIERSRIRIDARKCFSASCFPSSSATVLRTMAL
jgi:hypothetical protein